MFTSQVPVNNWYEIVGEQTIANAILNRIIHDAHRQPVTRKIDVRDFQIHNSTNKEEAHA